MQWTWFLDIECCHSFFMPFLAVPVQVIAWKDLSPKWPIMCRAGHKTLLTHLRPFTCKFLFKSLPQPISSMRRGRSLFLRGVVCLSLKTKHSKMYCKRYDGRHLRIKLLLTELFSASVMCRNRSISHPRIPRLFADEPNWCILQSTSYRCRSK